VSDAPARFMLTGAIMPETQPDLSHRAEVLLNFWFASESASKRDRLRDIWFQATPEFDAALAEHFRADYDRAATGVCGPWRDAPQTCLALILLLDQLPRNLLRNSPPFDYPHLVEEVKGRHKLLRGGNRS
jgi:uncharacterized protein (DUF924 family)